MLAGDHTPLAPIRFIMASEQQRQDVLLLELQPVGQAESLRALGSARPVYLVDTQKYYEMDAIERSFEVRPAGVLFKLIPRQKP